MIEENYKRWFQKNRRKFSVKLCSVEFLRKLPFYLISLEILLLYNLILSPTQPLTNMIITGLLISHSLYLLLKNCVAMWKLPRDTFLLKMEKELSIPHNLLSSGETIDDPTVKRILIKKLQPHTEKEIKILPPAIKKNLIATTLIFFFTVIYSPSTFFRIIFSLNQEKSGSGTAIVSWVTDLNFEIKPPPYTGQKPYELEGVEKIPLLMGSTVTIKFSTTVEVDKAELVTPGGRSIYFKRDGDIFLTSFTPIENGKYKILLVKKSKIYTDSTQPFFALREDKPPDVKILKPEKNLTVKLGEKVEFRVRVTDNYGIQKLKAVMLTGNEKKEEELELNEGEKYVEKIWYFDPEKDGFHEGDTVVIHFEAEDNNSFNGPGIGKSREIKIEIFSPVKAHRKLLRKEQHILDLLVDALDLSIRIIVYNEQKSGMWKKFRTQIIQQISILLPELRNDQFTSKEVVAFFEILRRKLASLPVPRKGKLRDIEVLEHLILKLDNLLKDERFQQIRLYQDQINFLREKLQDLINQYRQSHDPEIFREIEDTLRDLQQKLSELQNFINETTPYHLPDQFVNSEAYRNLSSGRLKREIEKLRKNLQNMDKESVIREAEDLLSKLSHFNQALSKAEEKFSASLQSVNAQLQRLEKELEFISKEHKKYMESLRRYNRKISKSASKRIRNMIKRILDEMNLSIPSFYLYSPPISKRIQKIKTENNLSDLKKLLKELKRYPDVNRYDIDDMLRKIDQTEREIKDIQNSSSVKFFERENRRFEKRTGEIERQLRDIATKYPHLAGKSVDFVSRSREKMNEAYQRIEKENTFKGYESEKKAQFWLDEAINAMKESRKELEKEREVYRKGVAKRGGYGETSGRPSEEKIKIPPPSRGYTEKRKEIIKSLEEGFPHPYRKINREYFKHLME